MYETGLRIAGLPIRIFGWTAIATVLLSVSAGRKVARTTLSPLLPRASELPPDPAARFEAMAGALQGPVTKPGAGWAVAAGIGVAFVYLLSSLVHGLAHLIATKACGGRPTAVDLFLAGGAVVSEDDDDSSAWRFALVGAAGLAASAMPALLFAGALVALGPPETTGAGVAAYRIVVARVVFNGVMLAFNLLPIAGLDCRRLLRAARLRLAC